MVCETASGALTDISHYYFQINGQKAGLQAKLLSPGLASPNGEHLCECSLSSATTGEHFATRHLPRAPFFFFPFCCWRKGKPPNLSRRPPSTTKTPPTWKAGRPAARKPRKREQKPPQTGNISASALCPVQPLESTSPPTTYRELLFLFFAAGGRANPPTSAEIPPYTTTPPAHGKPAELPQQDPPQPTMRLGEDDPRRRESKRLPVGSRTMSIWTTMVEGKTPTPSGPDRSIHTYIHTDISLVECCNDQLHLPKYYIPFYLITI